MSHLYHYTSEEGLRGIQRDGVIRSSSDTTRDAILGEGVYLTTLSPATEDTALVKNNWDGNKQFQSSKQENVSHCIQFSKKDLPSAQKSGGSRDVWVVPHAIDLKNVPHSVHKRK
jgi:hypothetical protein